MFHKNKTLLAIIGVAGTLILITGTVFGSYYFAKQLTKKDQQQTVKSCEPGKEVIDHSVVIQNDITLPSNTVAPLCDTLTISNQDDKTRLITFGLHDEHIYYDGITEKELKKGESFTITLVKPGDFLFHDHEQDEVGGTFTVTEN